MHHPDIGEGIKFRRVQRWTPFDDSTLVKAFALRASPLTTVVYTHPSDEEMYEGIKGLPC